MAKQRKSLDEFTPLPDEPCQAPHEQSARTTDVDFTGADFTGGSPTDTDDSTGADTHSERSQEPKADRNKTYRVFCRKRINDKVYALHGEIVTFDEHGIAEVSKEQFDFLTSIPGYEAK